MADKKTATEVDKTTKKTTAKPAAKTAAKTTAVKAAAKKTTAKKTTVKKTTASSKRTTKTTTKAFDDAVKAVIKDYKKKKQITEDDLTDKLVKPFELKSGAIDDLMQKIEDNGIAIVDENGEGIQSTNRIVNISDLNIEKYRGHFSIADLRKLKDFIDENSN